MVDAVEVNAEKTRHLNVSLPHLPNMQFCIIQQTLLLDSFNTPRKGGSQTQILFFEKWAVSKCLFNNGICVENVIKARGPVAGVLRMAATTWWMIKTKINCNTYLDELEIVQVSLQRASRTYMNCSNESLRSQHLEAEHTPKSEQKLQTTSLYGLCVPLR